jgi:predicted transcriptional regulator
MYNCMVELVSISEAARRTGRDFRTVHKIIHLAEVKVSTRTGNLYDLNQIVRF